MNKILEPNNLTKEEIIKLNIDLQEENYELLQNLNLALKDCKRMMERCDRQCAMLTKIFNVLLDSDLNNGTKVFKIYEICQGENNEPN